MQNMIKRIIEMDKQARELNDEAQSRRDGAAASVEEKKEEARRSYLNLAQRRIDVIRQAEMEDAHKRMHQISEQNRLAAERLQTLYDENCDKWVDEIVARVTKGDDLA